MHTLFKNISHYCDANGHLIQNAEIRPQIIRKFLRFTDRHLRSRNLSAARIVRVSRETKFLYLKNK